MASNTSRFESVSRRAFLRGTLVAGTLVLPVACAKSDEDALGQTATTTPNAAGTTPTTATAATAATDTTVGSETTTTGTGDTATTGAGATFPENGKLTVDFTFAASGGGMVKNPFIAVWVETPSGELVRTLSLWYEIGKGQRWINHLTRWYGTGGADADAVTSSTRVPGTYSVEWDGLSAQGSPVPQGDYVVYIEAAREHGPYELVSGDITIGTTAFSTELTPNGELSAASVKLAV